MDKKKVNDSAEIVRHIVGRKRAVPFEFVQDLLDFYDESCKNTEKTPKKSRKPSKKKLVTK